MKVLLITNSYLPQLGGLEIVVFNIAVNLLKSGHQVEIIAGVDNLVISSVIEDNFCVHRVPFMLPRVIFKLGWGRFWKSVTGLAVFPFLSWVVLLRMLIVCRNFKPDIVNLHYIGNNSIYALVLKKIFPCRLVVNIHGNDIEGIEDRPALARYLTVKTLKNADLVLSNSRYLLNEAAKIFPSVMRKYEVVGNGIKINEFTNIKTCLPENKYILSVANFTHKKGQDILIRAYARAKEILSSKLPDLLLAGDGPELKRCKGLARKLSLNASIKFLGRVNRKELPVLLKGCDFFVHPARKESFGIVILEAMACGKAIVATKVGGIPELIEENKIGILVNSESPKELAQAIVFLLKHPKLAQRLGGKGRTIVEEYRWDKVIDKYTEAYNSIL